MKIMDLRPWPTRLAHFFWQGRVAGNSGHTRSNKAPVKGLGSLISGITRHRLNGRPTAPLKPYIVSVGNLALGGTGKTPVVSALAQDLAAQGLRGAILTRGYRSPLTGPVVVEAQLHEAGDEARLLAREVKPADWIVVQAKDRMAGLIWLQENNSSLDIVIAEDAYQTPNLPRHLDVLIIDQWHISKETSRDVVSVVNGPIFPLGPYREDSIGAQRADIWLLENEPNELFKSGNNLKIEVATFQREVVFPEMHNVVEPYGVLSGIAKPWRFEESMTEKMGHEPALAVRCNDHVLYEPHLLGKIVAAAREAQVKRIFTTAKDWVKLQEIWPSDMPLEVVELKILWGSGKTLPALVGKRFRDFQHNSS